MIAQLQQNTIAPSEALPFSFLLVIYNPRIEIEKSVQINCKSDRFTDVMTEFSKVRRENQLFGYELIEWIDLSAQYSPTDLF